MFLKLPQNSLFSNQVSSSVSETTFGTPTPLSFISPWNSTQTPQSGFENYQNSFDSSLNRFEASQSIFETSLNNFETPQNLHDISHDPYYQIQLSPSHSPSPSTQSSISDEQYYQKVRLRQDQQQQIEQKSQDQIQKDDFEELLSILQSQKVIPDQLLLNLNDCQRAAMESLTKLTRQEDINNFNNMIDEDETPTGDESEENNGELSQNGQEYEPEMEKEQEQLRQEYFEEEERELNEEDQNIQFKEIHDNSDDYLKINKRIKKISKEQVKQRIFQIFVSFIHLKDKEAISKLSFQRTVKNRQKKLQCSKTIGQRIIKRSPASLPSIPSLCLNRSVGESEQFSDSFNGISSSSSSSSSNNSNNNRKKTKRVEEMLKMVFKRAFKYIQTQFFRSRCKKSRIASKDKDQQLFYEFYFGQLSSIYSIPLNNFYHPQKQFKKPNNSDSNDKSNNSSRQDRPGQKSFNQFYIELILKSELFRQKAEDYINKQFIQQVNQDRHHKIAKLYQIVLKCCEQINEKEEKNAQYQLTGEVLHPHKALIRHKKMVQACEELVRSNSKFKLPWTKQQLQQAIDLSNSLISKTKLLSQEPQPQLQPSLKLQSQTTQYIK